jgi:excinuclease UvrABC ATPase subunit
MMTDMVMNYPEGTKVQLLSPVVHAEKGTHKETLDKIRANGFTRLRVDGELTTIDEVKELEKNKKHTIDLVVDRIIVKPDNRSRVFESIETALDWSHGLLIIHTDFEEKVVEVYRRYEEILLRNNSVDNNNEENVTKEYFEMKIKEQKDYYENKLFSLNDKVSKLENELKDLKSIFSKFGGILSKYNNENLQ